MIFHLFIILGFRGPEPLNKIGMKNIGNMNIELSSLRGGHD